MSVPGTVSVMPDPAHTAGHALVRVAGAAGAVGAPGFRVQRDAEWTDATLGPQGWQSSDAVLQPVLAETDGADLLLHVGWDVCRFLEGGVYSLSVPGAGVEPTGVYWPDIAPIHTAPAAPKTPVTAPVPQAPSVPLPPPAVGLTPAPVISPGAAPGAGAGAPRARAGLFALIGLVLLAAVAGGIYAATRNRGATDQPAPTQAPPPSPPEATPPATPAPPPEPPHPTPPEPPSPPAPPDLTQLSVPDVLNRAPNVGAVTAEAQRRLGSTQRDDGLLLLEAAADRNDADAAAAMARLYDPVQFQPGGPIPRPDARQAARYYRDAARGGANVSAARDALKRMLETQAAGGDLGAGLVLKDFWP